MKPKEIRDLVNKKFGKGSSFIVSDREVLRVDVIPTGSLSLDIALGVGGLPRGRIIEIYGPESSGKTTLCQHIIAEAQAMGEICAFVDMEHALDFEYAEKCGVDPDNLLVSQPDTGENALEQAEIYIRNGCGVVVIDSVAALVPRAEIEGDMGDSHMGKQARLMSQACRKLSGIVLETGCILIFTNQLRMKIGIKFGSPETTTGGMALRFYASVRIDLRQKQQEKVDEEVVGNKVLCRVKKNKVAPPFKQCELTIEYNIGIDKTSDLISFINKGNIEGIEKAGSWYKIKNNNDELKIQGEQKLKNHLNENASFLNHIENQVRQSLRLPLVMN